MIGGIQLVFLIAMLGIEAVQRPATKLCLRITSKIGCATQRRPREGDDDVEVGGGEDGGAASSGSDDEDRPLLEPNRGGAMTQGERIAALEAMLSGVRHDVADNAALHTKTRDNATLIRTLFDGGSTPSTLRNDPRDELWTKTTLVVDCTGSADDLHERARVALGEFALTSARAPTLRPTWERAVEGGRLRIFFHRQRWRIGLLGEAPLARSVENADALSPLEVVWEVRANSAEWKAEEGLFLSAPRSGSVFERLFPRITRGQAGRAPRENAVHRSATPERAGEIDVANPMQHMVAAQDGTATIVKQAPPQFEGDNPMQQREVELVVRNDRLVVGVAGVSIDDVVAADSTTADDSAHDKRRAAVERRAKMEERRAAVKEKRKSQALAHGCIAARKPSVGGAASTKDDALPSGWERRQHEGRVFFTNVVTGKKQWENPSVRL
jgi:hypothetical protein